MFTEIDAYLRYFDGAHRRTVRDITALPAEAEVYRPETGEGENAWGITDIVRHMAGSRLYFSRADRGGGGMFDGALRGGWGGGGGGEAGVTFFDDVADAAVFAGVEPVAVLLGADVELEVVGAVVEGGHSLAADGTFQIA